MSHQDAGPQGPPTYEGAGGWNPMEHCDDCRQHIDDCICDDDEQVATTHQPILRTKIGSAYTTDDGSDVPSHRLFLYDCSCGQREHIGNGWYVSKDRALRSWERRTAASQAIR